MDTNIFIHVEWYGVMSVTIETFRWNHYLGSFHSWYLTSDRAERYNLSMSLDEHANAMGIQIKRVKPGQLISRTMHCDAILILEEMAYMTWLDVFADRTITYR